MFADDRSGSEYFFGTPIFSDGFESGDTDAWLGPFLLTVTRSGSGTGTLMSSPAGINCGADCTEAYNHGAQVTLTAVEAVGSSFAGWSGGGCSGVGTCVVTMTAATTVTATFTLNQYNLTTTRSGSGTGTITSSPAGINCGADCSELYDHGTQVTLTAAAAVGSAFAGWSDGGCAGVGTCVVTMTAATTVTATFTLNQYNLITARSGSGTGTITSSPAGIHCGADCSELYDHGTQVTLTAAAAVGSTFAGWSDGGCAGTGTCVVTMTAATTVTATFTLVTYTLTVSVFDAQGQNETHVISSLGGIDCYDIGGTCSANFATGTSLSLTLLFPMNEVFNGWLGACAGSGTTCNLTMNSDLSTTGRTLCNGPCI